MKNTIKHYDLLIDEGFNFATDSPILREYMDKWDGEDFIKQLNLSNNIDILEIGVGTGRLADKTINKCNSFVGIDISPKTIEKAKQNFINSQKIKLICGDFIQYNFDKVFDLIYSSLTFMHIEDKEKAIFKVRSLLNDKGRFVISLDKNQDNILDYGTRKIRIFPDNPNEIINLIEKSGMIFEEKFETEFAIIISAITP